MREVDETLLILKKFRFPDFYGTLSGLPRELWRKILHLTFLNRPGSKFFRRDYFLQSWMGGTPGYGGWVDTPLPFAWVNANFWAYYDGSDPDYFVSYVSRHTFATRLQASMRGLLQRWRDLKQDLKGMGRLAFTERPVSIREVFQGDMQLRLFQTPAQVARTQSNIKRWRRRLRRQHGETVAEGVLNSYYLRHTNTLFEKINWFDHRKRLGVKLLDFGS